MAASANSLQQATALIATTNRLLGVAQDSIPSGFHLPRRRATSVHIALRRKTGLPTELFLGQIAPYIRLGTMVKLVPILGGFASRLSSSVRPIPCNSRTVPAGATTVMHRVVHPIPVKHVRWLLRMTRPRTRQAAQRIPDTTSPSTRPQAQRNTRSTSVSTSVADPLR